MKQPPCWIIFKFLATGQEVLHICASPQDRALLIISLARSCDVVALG